MFCFASHLHAAFAQQCKHSHYILEAPADTTLREDRRRHQSAEQGRIEELGRYDIDLIRPSQPAWCMANMDQDPAFPTLE